VIAANKNPPDDDGEKPPESKGVLGDGALHPGKYNMRLIGRAIREGWKISQKRKAMIVSQMAAVVERSEEERNQIGAARVLVAADGVNVKREALEQASDNPSTTQVNVAVGVTVQQVMQEELKRTGFYEYESAKLANGGHAADPSPPSQNGNGRHVDSGPALNGDQPGVD
jgi:hypothetical protein